MSRHIWYKTTQDIVIPKGTTVSSGCSSVKFFVPHAMGIVDHTEDITSTWYMDMSEALELGLIEEV